MIFLTEIGRAFRKQDDGYDKVELTVWYGEIRNTITVLDGRLIDGYWEFPGLEQTVRAVMERNDYSIDPAGGVYKKYVGDTYTTEQKSIHVLYKAVAFTAHADLRDADDLVSYHFLTPHRSAVVFEGSSYTLRFYNTSDEEYTINYTRRDGAPAYYIGVKDIGRGSLAISYSQLFSKADIQFGNRKFEVYYSPLKACEEFKFRNVFNIEEVVSLPASCVTSPTTDFEEAVQGKIRKKYDVEHDVEMTVTTAELPRSMYSVLLALCRSRKVERKEQYTAGGTTYTTYREVIVKEYKLDLPDNPGEGLSLEMKLAYADMRACDAVVIE